MGRHITSWLSAGALLQIAVFTFGAPNAWAEPRSLWSRNLNAMFKRSAPREFVRYPEDVWELTRQNDGFYTQIAFTAVAQHASNSRTRRDRLLNATYDFAGAWEPTLNSKLSWWVRGGRPIGAPRDADLSADIGSELDINATLENEAVYLRELYWAQGLGNRFRYSLGWIDSAYRYDFNAVANSEHSFFVALPFVNSSTIPFPEAGIGMDLLWQAGEAFEAHAGVYQGNCDLDSFSCVSRLDSDEYLAPFEIRIAPDISGLGKGNYRFMAFYVGKRGAHGTGFSASLDQRVGRFTPFLRVSYADAEISTVERFLSVGIGFQAPFGRPYDYIGAGYAAGKPSDPRLRTEKIVELFWRLRLNNYLTLTPDLQIVYDPMRNPAKDRVTIAGLRLQLDF